MIPGDRKDDIDSLTKATLRPLIYQDKELLFKWRNIPEIIRLSSSRKKVEEEEHSNWFNRTLTSDNTKIFIIEELKTPIGQVRFDRDGTGCLISIYLTPEHIGKGRGSDLVLMGIKKISETWKGLQWVDAYIRLENIRSIKAFEKAGFRVKKYGVDFSGNPDLTAMRFEVSWLSA
jgi:RimJ/RimL family protein N-acetyltransferase